MDPIHAFVKNSLDQLPDLYEGKLPRNKAKNLYLFTDVLESMKLNSIFQHPYVFFTTMHGLVCFNEQENTYVGFSWPLYEQMRSNLISVSPETQQRLIALTEEGKINFKRYVDHGYKKFEANDKEYAVAAIIYPDESSVVEVAYEVISPEDIVSLIIISFSGSYLDLTEQLYEMKSLALPEVAATSELLNAKENA